MLLILHSIISARRTLSLFQSKWERMLAMLSRQSCTSGSVCVYICVCMHCCLYLPSPPMPTSLLPGMLLLVTVKQSTEKTILLPSKEAALFHLRSKDSILRWQFNSFTSFFFLPSIKSNKRRVKQWRYVNTLKDHGQWCYSTSTAAGTGAESIYTRRCSVRGSWLGFKSDMQEMSR